MATGSKRSDRETVVTLRLPRELHQQLSDEAKGNGRGFAAEVRRRLEESLSDGVRRPADPRFANLLSALAHAAEAAGRMFPARKVTVSQSLARQIGVDSREVEDTDACWLFEACAADLMDAFRPIGVSGRLSDDRKLAVEAYQAEIARAEALIVGSALGQLGARGADAFNRLAPIDQEAISASGPLGERLAAEAQRIAEARDEQ